MIIIIIAILIYLDTNYENYGKNSFLIEEFGRLEVHFCPEDNCSDIIISEIQSTNQTICAFYDLNDEKIIEALKQKKANVLIDEDNYDEYGYSIKGNGLMHNKFCVLDEKTVITGSFNPTQDNMNNNNFIIIQSPTLAKNYEEEFFELRNERKKNKRTDINRIMFNNHTIQQYFCPEDNCKEVFLDEIGKTEHSIYFLTFTFTDNEIAQEIIEKKQEGADVKGVIESFQNKQYWTYPQLIEANISINLDNKATKQHNKLFIIDNKIVITGSFNPTKSANTINDENILVITQPDIVQEYVNYFEYIYASNN